MATIQELSPEILEYLAKFGIEVQDAAALTEISKQNPKLVATAMISMAETTIDAEMRASEAEEKLEEFLNQILEGCISYELDENGQLIFINSNRSAREITKADYDTFVPGTTTINEAFPGLNEQVIEKYDMTVVEMYTKIAEGKMKDAEFTIDYEGMGVYYARAFSHEESAVTVFFINITKEKIRNARRPLASYGKRN